MRYFQVRLVALLAFGFEESLRRLLISSISPALLTCFNPCNYNKINPNTRSLIEALEGVNHVNEQQCVKIPKLLGPDVPFFRCEVWVDR